MDHFRAPDGSFRFPYSLFPVLESGNSDPLSVSERIVALLDAAPPPHALASLIDQAATLAIPESEELSSGHAADIIHALQWAVSALRFADTWCELPVPVIAAAIDLLESGAKSSSSYAGHCAVALAASPRISAKQNPSLLKTGIEKNVYAAYYIAGQQARPRSKALKRYELGSLNNDSSCLYALSLACFYGLDRAKDTASALNLLKKATKAYFEARPQHLNAVEFDFDPYMISAASLYVLGKILLGEGGEGADGLNIPLLTPELLAEFNLELDVHTGFSLVTTAARMDYSPALARVGYAYSFGVHVETDYPRALHYLSLVAVQELHSLERGTLCETKGAACAQLAKWFLCGAPPYIDRDVRQAFHFAEAGVQLGNSMALFALGYFYETGTIVPRSLERAHSIYTQSAADGCEAARKRLQSVDEEANNSTNSLARSVSTASSDYSRTSSADSSTDISTRGLPKLDTACAKLPYPVLSPIDRDGVEKRGVFLPYPDSDEEDETTPIPETISLPTHPIPTQIPTQEMPEIPSTSAPQIPPAPSVPSVQSAIPAPATAPAIAPATTPAIAPATPNLKPGFPLKYPVSPEPTLPNLNSNPHPQLQPNAFLPPWIHSNTASVSSIDSPSIESTHSVPTPQSSSPVPSVFASAPSLQPPTLLSEFKTPSPASSPSLSSASSHGSQSGSHARSHSQFSVKSHSPSHSIDIGKARSASPLRKMFNSPSAQERSNRSRAERRSFTMQALQDLQSVPKVPVCPINEERQPGVAYTFEEMGVKTVSEQKRKNCVVQ